MAHLRVLDRPCQHRSGGCGARATVELRNSHNDVMGVFCRGHGVAEERALQAREDEQADRRRAGGFDVVG